MVTASAPGKIILFGEHAVVYGRPAIAAPLSDLRAIATVDHSIEPGVRLIAPDLGLEKQLENAAFDDAFALVVRQVQEEAGLDGLPDMEIMVRSDIPIAGGLGSGAAITAALVRALAEFLQLDHLADNGWISRLTYEVEKIHHGTPSGIDNTVVSYEQPVYFVKRPPQNLVETFAVARPLHLLIADTGDQSSTKVVVDDVRKCWQTCRKEYEALFDLCGEISETARKGIEAGDLRQLGRLMNENHRLLQEMAVSSDTLDRLVLAAQQAGALGAKLSGAGRGGNMLALVTEAEEGIVKEALLDAGAKSVFSTTIN